MEEETEEEMDEGRRSPVGQQATRVLDVSRFDQESDNSSFLLEKMGRCYAEQLLSDVTLRVGDRSFPAHRLILCASSDVFRVMLMSASYSESRSSTIVLQEHACCLPFFPDFLLYLYTVSPA